MSRATGSRRRAILGWGALAAAVIVIALIGGPGSGGGSAFDPRSTSGNGTKALVLLVDQIGGTAAISADVPGAGTDVAVVLSDQLSSDRRDGLMRWVRAGGTLVVADPGSDLQLSGPAPAPSTSEIDGPCPAAGLGDVGRVATGGSDLLEGAPGAVGCFAVHGNYLLLSAPAGQGRVVALGGAGPFTDSELGRDDNAVLAADLLVPSPGTRVQVLLRSPVGGGHRSLWQLLGRPVRLALGQLLVAFAALAWWRARRLGRPVTEPVPVVLPGSELTLAVGNLMARARQRDAAAAGLRHGIRQWLGRRLGFGPTVTADRLADAVATRLGADKATLLRTLSDGPVASDADLIALAQSIEQLRQEVTGVRAEP